MSHPKKARLSWILVLEWRRGINGTGFGASPSFDLFRRAAGLFAVNPTIQD
jgi:hypothetical protein